MKADKSKLKEASIDEILQEIQLVTEELSDMMFPPSGARAKELLQYKQELFNELDRKK